MDLFKNAHLSRNLSSLISIIDLFEVANSFKRDLKIYDAFYKLKGYYGIYSFQLMGGALPSLLGFWKSAKTVWDLGYY